MRPLDEIFRRIGRTQWPQFGEDENHVKPKNPLRGQQVIPKDEYPRTLADWEKGNPDAPQD